MIKKILINDYIRDAREQTPVTKEMWKEIKKEIYKIGWEVMAGEISYGKRDGIENFDVKEATEIIKKIDELFKTEEEIYFDIEY